MKKLCLILSLFAFSSMVSSQPLNVQELIDIQLEISYLAAKREALVQNINTAHHTEVNDQVKSMQNMRDYHWTRFTSDLNEAEKSENLAKEDLGKLHYIDHRILELNSEAEALLSPSSSRL
jgi:hypothetical protein